MAEEREAAEVEMEVEVEAAWVPGVAHNEAAATAAAAARMAEEMAEEREASEVEMEAWLAQRERDMASEEAARSPRPIAGTRRGGARRPTGTASRGRAKQVQVRAQGGLLQGGCPCVPCRVGGPMRPCTHAAGRCVAPSASAHRGRGVNATRCCPHARAQWGQHAAGGVRWRRGQRLL
jgi:hypothetical protein